MALSPDDIKQATDQINAYASQLDDLAKSAGIDPKVAGNDPAELTKAAAAGAAVGAGGAAPFAAAAGPFAPAVIAAGAIIGALAGFFEKFHFGPTPEQIALAAEFDKLNKTIHGILLTVPQPYRAQLTKIIL